VHALTPVVAVIIQPGRVNKRGTACRSALVTCIEGFDSRRASAPNQASDDVPQTALVEFANKPLVIHQIEMHAVSWTGACPR
jgi:hypothetical protein